MLNLKAEISAIIKNQDFIILPFFGAFQADYSKPYINSSGELIESTRKQIFIPQFKKDLDNKLLNILVSKSSLPISILSKELENFISGISNSIFKEKHYTWGNLGLFFLNDKNEIEFIESIANKEVINSNIIKPILAESNDNELISENSDVSTLPNNNIESQPVRINYYKLALYVVPFLLLISGLLWTVFLKPNDKNTLKRGILTEIDSLENSKLNFENEIVEDRLPPEEEVVTNKKNIKSKQLSSSSNKIEVIKKENSPEFNNEKNIRINIGSYKSKENVNNLTTYLAENGIPAKVTKDQSYYIVYVIAANKDQAERFSAKILDLTGEKPSNN